MDLTDSSEAAQKKVDDLEQKSTWLADELSKSKAAYHTALEQRKHDQAMIQDLQEELSSLKSGTQVEEAPDKARAAVCLVAACWALRMMRCVFLVL